MEENFRAAAYAVTAGILLVVVLYVAYILIPLLLLLGTMAIVFYVQKDKTPISADKPDDFRVNW